jgi:hydroxymethylpyrimidine pyrophosphatase-like HAD family hydrolase
MEATARFPYRLAAIDLDDTLLGPDKRISEQNASAVQSLRNLGVMVVLASGRSYENILNFHQQLGLRGRQKRRNKHNSATALSTNRFGS